MVGNQCNAALQFPRAVQAQCTNTTLNTPYTTDASRLNDHIPRSLNQTRLLLLMYSAAAQKPTHTEARQLRVCGITQGPSTACAAATAAATAAAIAAATAAAIAAATAAAIAVAIAAVIAAAIAASRRQPVLVVEFPPSPLNVEVVQLLQLAP